MKLEVEKKDLEGVLNTSGSDRSWRDRVKSFCKQHRLTVDFLAREATRIFSPEIRKRDMRHRVHQIRTRFENKKAPSVCVSIRRLVAYLTTLVKRGKPIPLQAQPA